MVTKGDVFVFGRGQLDGFGTNDIVSTSTKYEIVTDTGYNQVITFTTSHHVCIRTRKNSERKLIRGVGFGRICVRRLHEVHVLFGVDNQAPTRRRIGAVSTLGVQIVEYNLGQAISRFPTGQW